MNSASEAKPAVSPTEAVPPDTKAQVSPPSPTAGKAAKARKPAAAKSDKAKVPVKPDKVSKAAKPEPAAKAEKVKKPKLVRDSFTIPKTEYEMIDALKARAVRLKHPAKKSEVLRAGLKLLVSLTDASFRSALQAVPTLKTGRPKADKPAV